MICSLSTLICISLHIQLYIMIPNKKAWCKRDILQEQRGANGPPQRWLAASHSDLTVYRRVPRCTQWIMIYLYMANLWLIYGWYISGWWLEHVVMFIITLIIIIHSSNCIGERPCFWGWEWYTGWWWLEYVVFSHINLE